MAPPECFVVFIRPSPSGVRTLLMPILYVVFGKHKSLRTVEFLSFSTMAICIYLLENIRSILTHFDRIFAIPTDIKNIVRTYIMYDF